MEKTQSTKNKFTETVNNYDLNLVQKYGKNMQASQQM